MNEFALKLSNEELQTIGLFLLLAYDYVAYKINSNDILKS